VTAMTASGSMPIAFFGHGSPMNALEKNRYTEAWRAFGARFGSEFPMPRAVLMVSAHWYMNATAVTAMKSPRTIHDFYGFPEELFRVQYPAPGSPELAKEVAELLSPTWVGMDEDSWGIDHGTWSVLVHVFPRADVPVVQLSIDATKSFEEHFLLGTRLVALRNKGVLVLGSGNVVHNLRLINWSQPEEGYPWARRFDSLVAEAMLRNPSEVLSLTSLPDFPAAAPTPDHFIPLLYIAGMASAAKLDPPEVTAEGYAFGALSMTSYVFT
jgi:4,5-DOPA dioxygenase extradiol